jgi:uncharacterized protein (TIGR00288 family)
MDTSVSRADVAVFVDFENIYVSVREKFDATPNFELIMDRCEDYGRIVLARAYADWYRYPRVTSALFANGVEPMYVPTYYYDREVGRTGRPIKNSVDIHLCIDAMRTLYTQAHINKFVLVTGDRDFIPLVNAIRQSGKDVIVIGIGGAASAHLAQSADEFMFYEQIADLKTPQQQRQEQRSERRERPVERADRSESNGKAERRERQAERPAPPAERNVYDTLVDAINLARQRGFVSNLGSLKVLMRELDSTFKESKVRDSSGRPFAKFKEFVQEAERLGKVQIFTNGTVTEVFLPGEDPYRLSQFAEELATQRAERELESELDDQEPSVDLLSESAANVEEAEPEAKEVQPAAQAELVDQAEQPATEAVQEAVEEQQISATPELPEQRDRQASPEPAQPSFSNREWEVVLVSLSQFTEPVRFIEIFSTLRSLRNQELLDLTNTELKDLVKQAINRGVLQRTGRGAKAYYRLSSQYRNMQLAKAEAAETASTALDTTNDAVEATGELGTEAATIPEQSTAERSSKAARRRRRGRSKETVTHTDSLGLANETTPDQVSETQLATVVGEQPDTAATDTIAAGDMQPQQTAKQPERTSTRTRRNRRKKAASTQETPAQEETEAAQVEQPALSEAEVPSVLQDTVIAQAETLATSMPIDEQAEQLNLAEATPAVELPDATPSPDAEAAEAATAPSAPEAETAETATASETEETATVAQTAVQVEEQAAQIEGEGAPAVSETTPAEEQAPASKKRRPRRKKTEQDTNNDSR